MRWDSNSHEGLHQGLALKMRLRFGQASLKGNDIPKKQHEQKHSVEPTRKTVLTVTRVKNSSNLKRPGKNIKGGGFWKTTAQSQ